MAERFEFSDEELEDRYLDHFKLATDYANAIERDFQVEIKISIRRLYLTIISAYEDIARYKNYHLDDPANQKSDAVKRASYLTKWICRFKPFHVVEGSFVDLDKTGVDKTMIVNELFALHLASLHLSDDVQKDFVIAPDKGYEISYEMMYRHLNEDSYLLIFQMIRDHVTGGKDIVQVI